MSKKRPLELVELPDGDLDQVAGGSQQLFTTVHLGLNPSHQYGLISDTFGQNKMSFQQANDLVQRYNAPTREALYGQGNDPHATMGMVSRPGAQDLSHGLDWGGEVTLDHDDGYARNTTVDFQHPLEGTITRNLVVDLHDGGGYQVLTLGRGEGGAQLATLAGAEIAGVPGAVAAQNLTHVVNPGLGMVAFGQTDAAMLATANGTHNPNLDGPSGRGIEVGTIVQAAVEGVENALGFGPTPPHITDQQQTLGAVAKTLNDQGPVNGYFSLSNALPGVYFTDAKGTTYYELDHGHAVAKQVDEMAGVDAAVASNAAVDATHQPPPPADDVVVPSPFGITTTAPVTEDTATAPAHDAPVDHLETIVPHDMPVETPPTLGDDSHGVGSSVNTTSNATGMNYSTDTPDVGRYGGSVGGTSSDMDI